MIPRGSPPPPPPPPLQQHQQQRRKKWTEEEERALIDKYAAMAADGSLARLRTRERRFRPIAEHVNAQHHAADPAAFPFAWSWKDASTKVQNMRHQFLLVKQKLLSASPLLPHQSDSSPHHHPALSLWPNFLHYRDVFGDAPLPLKPPSDPSAAAPELGDEAEAEAEAEAERPARSRRKKRRRRRREAAEERRRRRWEKEEEEEREREREWEERMERRRAEWRKRADDAARQHRAEMEHIHARIVHDHHAFLNHLLGFFSNWVGGGGGVSDGVGGAAPSPGNHHHNHNSSYHSNHYMSQMMQGLHQVNGTVPEEENPTTTTEDGHEDQFIVD